MPSPTAPVRLLLLRHGQVDGHRGDVPITEAGHRQARSAGRWITEHGYDVAAVLFGGTRRTRETATSVLAGMGEAAAGIEVADAFALRNPDLYLGGDRVTMVSTAEAFAEQTSAMSAEDVLAIGFFRQWLEHPDRVGWWVAHPAPPGDDAASVRRRMHAFVGSLADVPSWRGRTVVAVTHSPVLRSVGVALYGEDRGEPPCLHGYAASVRAGASETYGEGLRGSALAEVAPTTS